jgi:putative ABC transport system permease protein
VTTRGGTIERRPGRLGGDAWSTSVEPFRNNFVRRSTKQGLWLLLAAVGFLLLIACANVANLMLARGGARQRELAVRAALGATNGAIARQLLNESLVLGVGRRRRRRALRVGTLSVPVLVFALGVCVVSGALSGCAPAWQAARANLADAIKEGGRSISGGRHRLRRMLVAMEFALALTLLAGGGMAAHAFNRTMSTARTSLATSRNTSWGSPALVKASCSSASRSAVGSDGAGTG